VVEPECQLGGELELSRGKSGEKGRDRHKITLAQRGRCQPGKGRDLRIQNLISSWGGVLGQSGNAAQKGEKIRKEDAEGKRFEKKKTFPDEERRRI